MKFHCGLTDEARSRQTRAEWEAKCRWHRWFAWYPITIGTDGDHKVCIWLETVERYWRTFSSWEKDRWEYRRLTKP